MTAHVRPLTAEDRPAWTALFRDYLAFYGATLPAAVLEGSFARLLDPQRADRFGLVAVVDGEVAGIANCILHGHNWRTEDVCYLQDLFVAPEFRGRRDWPPADRDRLHRGRYTECTGRLLDDASVQYQRPLSLRPRMHPHGVHQICARLTGALRGLHLLP